MSDRREPQVPSNEAPPPLMGGHGPVPLSARAPAPRAHRVKPSAIRLVMAGAGAIVASALIYGFVIAPKVQAEARNQARAETVARASGKVEPAAILAEGPKSYSDPRAGLGPNPPPVEPVQTSSQPPSIPLEPAGPAHEPRFVGASDTSPQRGPQSASETQKARTSELFVDGAAHTRSVTPTPEPDPAPPKPVLALKADYNAVYGDRAILAPLSAYELKAGTVLPAALLTALDTERAGRVLAVITENVFDTVTGQKLLIPQGARLLGRYDGDQAYGDKRAFLVWERIIFADGRSLTLNAEQGVDVQGAAGIAGRVDRRLGQLAIAALFSGAITSLGEAARRQASDKSNTLIGDAGDAAALEAARVGGKLVDRELGVKPTLRVREGTRVQVLLTRDLIVEPGP